MKKGLILKKGFTLVELLVVVAVIAILAAITVVAINPAKKLSQSRDAARKSSMQQIVTAMATYYTQNASYTATTAELVSLGELKSLPKGPTGNDFSYAVNPSTCTTAGKTCTGAVIYDTYEQPNTACTTGTAYWGWTSGSGIIGKICTAGTPAYTDVPVVD